MIPFSVLDLSPVPEGSTAGDALRNTRELARLAEKLGYNRYWLAEHHNMPGIASAATAVAIGYVAEATSTIRVGSGGIMLPNHAPLMVAEQFGTLESLYPGRIDLGLGRAPGTDQLTMRALRRGEEAADQFPRDVMELMIYFGDPEPNQRIRAVPGAGLKVPVWLLGSSLFSAQLAAMLGLPFAFASHFAPDLMMQAVEIYRSRFEPSEQLERPYVMLGANVIAAETDAEARRLFTSQQQSFVRLRRGEPGKLPPPIDNPEEHFSAIELAGIERSLAVSFVGARDTIRSGLQAFIEKTGTDELIVTGHIYDHAARLKSFEIAAEARDLLKEPRRESAA
ncbi:MAG: LLM class flavin-dependent oxidoreductase [Parvibaculaceae bacterium]